MFVKMKNRKCKLGSVQTCVNDYLVDLGKFCKCLIIDLQKSVLIQPRKSLLKFDDLAEKSEKDSISNL